MFSILTNVGPALPFTMILLALLGLRARVTPRTSVWIKTTPAKLWALIDLYDGKQENWGNVVIEHELVDEKTQSFRKTFTITQSNGTVRSSQAYFDVFDRQPEKSLTLNRGQLQGKPENNELLKITHELTPEKDGTRLRTAYYWGSRPLIAQLLARADLWSGAFRLKGLAETGKPDDKPYVLISAAVALVTGLLSVGGFGIIVGLDKAIFIVLALFVHEFGHLLAYRLVGQPWGRMVFLPFLGALAVPRLPFESQGQAVFAALMGPGFSILLAVLCAVPGFLDGQIHPYMIFLGLITAMLNLFNLLPAEPLDGGVALRSVLARVIGKYANYGLMTIGAIIVVVGFATEQIAIVIFGGLAVLANLKVRKIDAGQIPLTRLQICIFAFGYVAIASGHLTLLRFFINQFFGLQG